MKSTGIRYRKTPVQKQKKKKKNFETDHLRFFCRR